MKKPVKLRKVGNSLVATVSNEQVNKKNLKEGDLALVDVTPVQLEKVSKKTKKGKKENGKTRKEIPKRFSISNRMEE